MWSGIAVDGAWVAALAAVTLADGLRRAPRGSRILRRYGIGPWQDVTPQGDGPFHVLAWWSPLTLTVITAPSTHSLPTGPQGLERLESVRLLVSMLRAMGVLALITLVIGLPALAGFLGLAGFASGVAALLVLATGVAALYGIGLARLGVQRSRRFWKAAALLWPFSTPLAAERLLNEALAGASWVAVSRMLLPPDAFQDLIRPKAFDLLQGGAPDAELLAELSREELLAVVERGSPEATARTICRRCGATWRQLEGTCPECGVPLVLLERTAQDGGASISPSRRSG